MLYLIVVLVILGTAVWVDQDARKLVAAGATKAQMGGNSPLTWSVCTILLWIIVFPWYLVKRGQVRQEISVSSFPKLVNSSILPAPPPPSGSLPDLGWYVDPTNALQQRF